MFLTSRPGLGLLPGGGRPFPADQSRSEELPPNPVSLYGKSKLGGEIVLHPFADRVPITIVRPPGVFGPWDVHFLEAFRLVRRGWYLSPGVGQPRMALISVNDLAAALLLAAEKGRRLLPGDGPDAVFQGYYFVAHEEQPTFPELGRLIAMALNRKPPWIVKVPSPLCWALAGLVEFAGRMRRKQGLFNFDKAREATAGSWICRTDRACAELGFRPSGSLLDQLRDTAGWYAEQNWL